MLIIDYKKKQIEMKACENYIEKLIRNYLIYIQ